MLPLFALILAAPCAPAGTPEGYLDHAGSDLVGGWARDPDWPHPIPVHIYIDGEIAHAMAADALRSDLPYADQEHGFTWTPPLQGAGSHSVVAYAIGVDASGVPDGENPSLTGSPGTIADGCAGFAEPALTWCNGVPAYYRSRAEDTEYLFNDQLRVGVNTSYGGTIFELYAADHSFNLLSEHGGGAVQLSVWGYEPAGADAWFGQGDGVCDPTPYATEGLCRAAGHTSCRLWCCSEGAHVTNCDVVDSCVDWGAGAPFNPIQAQARSCGWDSTTNDVDSTSTSGASVTTRKSGPYHFTRSDAFSGMTFQQTVTLHDAYVELDYRITYTGPYTLGEHPQEIPAVFPGAGLSHSYWYYAGASPYTDAGSAVSRATADPDGIMFRIRGRDPYPHGTWDAVLTEHWVSTCEATGTHCLTVAVFSEQYKEIDAAAYPGNGYGYLTPLGGFAIVPGLDERFTAFLFPYRHDETVAGKTVRQWIFELAATELPPEDTGTGPGDDSGTGPVDDSGTGPVDDSGGHPPGDTDPGPTDSGATNAGTPPGDRVPLDGWRPGGGCGCGVRGRPVPSPLLLLAAAAAIRRRRT